MLNCGFREKFFYISARSFDNGARNDYSHSIDIGVAAAAPYIFSDHNVVSFAALRIFLEVCYGNDTFGGALRQARRRKTRRRTAENSRKSPSMCRRCRSLCSYLSFGLDPFRCIAYPQKHTARTVSACAFGLARSIISHFRKNVQSARSRFKFRLPHAAKRRSTPLFAKTSPKCLHFSEFVIEYYHCHADMAELADA